MFESLILAHGNIELRNIVYEALTSLGYQVTNSLTYTDVFEVLKKMRPDYIVFDKKIIKAAPEEVLEKVKAIDAKMKVIFIEPEENTAETVIAKILKVLKENRCAIPMSSMQQKPQTAFQFKANILIVDNEKECVDLIKIFLSKKGFNIDTAISGEEAILKINAAKPDIVLLDICMGGMDGISALKNIKGIDNSIIVIMTTAMGEDQIIQDAMKLGADGYLVKPFNLDELEKTMIDNALKKSSGR